MLCHHLKPRLIATPSAILPLALTTVNLGTVWVVASATILEGHGNVATARLLDVCGSFALVFILSIPVRFILHPNGSRAFWIDFTSAIPPYAAGIMAMWSLTGWWHSRSASGFAAVLWIILLVLFLFSQICFLRRIAWIVRSAPSRCTSTLWQKMEPPWIVPLVCLQGRPLILSAHCLQCSLFSAQAHPCHAPTGWHHCRLRSWR